MKFKHQLLTAVLALGLLLPAGSLSAQASYYRHAYVTRPTTVYRFIQGDCFADNRLGKRLHLKHGRSITLAAFYHMGKDGYMLHVKGHGRTVYYARTNSTHWFKY